MHNNQDVPIRKIEELIGILLLTPSGDNCQPWFFEWNGEILLITHDDKRALHALNPNNYASLISLGCLFKVLEIATQQIGLRYEVLNVNLKDFICVKLKVTNTHSLGHFLYSSIKKRFTDRRQYQLFNMDEELQNKLYRISENSNINFRILSNASNEATKYFSKSEAFMMSSRNVFLDLLKWVRFSYYKQYTTKDGMSLSNIGCNKIDGMFFKFLAKFPCLIRPMYFMFGKIKLYFQFLKNYKSTPHYLSYSVDSFSEENLICVGKLAMEHWLYLTSQGFSLQPMTIPSLVPTLQKSGIELFDEHSVFFRKGVNMLKNEIGINEKQELVWMFRVGKCTDVLPKNYRTLRRNVADHLKVSLDSSEKLSA